MRAKVLLATAPLLLVSCAGDGATSSTTPPEGDTTATVTQPDSASTTTSATTNSSDTGADDPCALVDGDVVATALGASSASGEPGIARNCHFTIDAGVSPSVEVFHYGPSDQWDGVRQGYVDNRGGVTDVPGIGEEAFQPNDVGPYEIVVRANGVIFAVAVQEGSGGAEVEAAIVALAEAIAGG